MPNASKYIIDVANIRPGGNPIKGLYVGSSEKKYATLGNKCIYDKVLYELSVDNITNVEPNAQTVTISSYRSKRTHGNGAVDTLYINPSTKQVTANTSTASTKDTTVVVNQALTLNGATTGTGVTVTITQMKDYPTGLTLTISPKSTIPAAGGSISSDLTNYTYSVKANYKSGNNNVDVTSNAATTITANVTGVTAASKGTTASNATTAGAIRFTAKYVCNGKTVTTTADVNITQDRNEVVSYANPTFTLTPSSNQTLPASGGSVTASVSNVQQVRTWSSTSTDTITPSYTTEWTARTISCNSRGTVTGDTLTLGATTATVTANGKPTTKSYVVYQQANAITAYSKPTGLNLSCADIPAGGGTVTAATGGTISQTITYTSKATVTINPTVTITWNPSQTATANSLGTTVKERTKITTLTATYTANSQSNTASVDVYQGANAQSTTPLWGDISLTDVTLSCEDVPARGGTVTPSWSGTAKQNRRYQYTSGSYTDWELVNITPTVSWSPTSKTGNNLGQTDRARTSLGDCTATFTGNSSKTATKAITVYQEANTHTDSWNSPVVTITYATFSAAGATKTPTTCSATQSGTRTWTSGSQTGITNADFTWGNYSMTNGNGFTLANASTGAVTAESRGTTTGASRSNSTIRRIATGAGSKQGTGSGTVTQEANDITNSNTNPFNYTVSVSIGDGLTAAGGSATVTASASHKAYNTYTSTAVDTTAHSVTDTPTISVTTNGNNRFSLNGNTLSHSNMTTNLTTDTVVITAKNSSNTSTTATDTKNITNTRQKEDSTSSNYVATISIGNGITAAGGSATVTASASHTNTYTWAYTSGSKQTGQIESVSDTANVTEDSDPNNRFSYSNGTLTHGSMGTTATTDTCTLRVRNASSITTTNIASVSVQNKIESYNTTDTNYTASVSIGNGLTAAGGSATVTASGSHTHTSTPVYTSGVKGSTSTTYPSDGATWSITTNGNNRFTINGNTLNHSSMGTTATTDTVVVTATNNNSATATATDRKDISNGYTDSWDSPVVTFNPASLSFTSGASSQNITASATQSGTRTFDSTSTSSLSNSDFTWSWNKGSSDTWITIGTGGKATKSITVTANSGNARSGSVTATATGAGSKTGSKSASVEQARKESEEEGPFYDQLDISQVTLSCNDVPASGGIVYPSWEGIVKQYFYYTKDGVVTTTGWTNITPTVTWSPTSKTGSDLGTTVKARTSLGDCTATFTGNSSKTATKAITVYQQANDVTSTEWGDLSLTAVTLSCGDVPARGGTVTPSWSGTAKQNRRYQYTSGSYSSWELVNITPTVTWNPTSISGGDLGTTVIARTSIGDCTATFTGNSSRTATKSITVYQQANAVISTTWGDITVTVPSNQSVTSASDSLTLTSNNTKASQTRSDTYTSGSESSKTINYTPDVSWEVSSNNTEFTTGHTIVGGGPLPKISWGENTSTSSRSATITVSYTANGKKGSNSFTITQSGRSFECTIKNNSSTYGVYGNFGGPAGEKFPGDFGAGANRPQYMNSGTVVLTDYFGVLQPSKTSGTVTFNCSGNGGSGTMSGNIQSNGTVNLTGILTVKDGSTLTITIS